MVVRLFVHTKPNSHKIHELSPQVSKATHGMVDKPWPAQLNMVVWEKRHNKEKSLVLSIGQVVPHGKIRYNVQNVGIDAVWSSVACRSDLYLLTPSCLVLFRNEFASMGISEVMGMA